jgi:hypothetical protein
MLEQWRRTSQQVKTMQRLAGAQLSSRNAKNRIQAGDELSDIRRELEKSALQRLDRAEQDFL